MKKYCAKRRLDAFAFGQDIFPDTNILLREIIIFCACLFRSDLSTVI